MKNRTLLTLSMLTVCIAIYLFAYARWQNGGKGAIDQAFSDSAGQQGTGRPPLWQGNGETPEGYKQLLPRGAIPAIDNPKYVSVSDAQVSDETYVFGLVVEGQPLAYSLNLLNQHEVVNDTVGSTNFAAVW